MKYVDYTIDDNKKIISINFNKEIYTSKESIKELKESIRIIIDKNNIYNNKIEKNKNTENNINYEEKYIKLNKYDNVKLDGKSLIIELDDELIGNNSSIVITTDTIRDDDNDYLGELKIENIQGINKNIAFVKTEEELNKYMNKEDIDIVKLEKDIEILKDLDYTIKNKVIIDGSNGDTNFKISKIGSILKEILVIENEVELKHLDLEGVYISIANKENIALKDMKIDLKNKKVINKNENNTRIDKSGIEIEKSIVECKDLILLSNKYGIEVIERNLVDSSIKRSTIIIDGYVYNEKTDENRKYKPTIVLENNTDDIKNNRLNKIVLKNEGNNIEDMFIKEIKNINEGITGSDKTYEIYYKK